MLPKTFLLLIWLSPQLVAAQNCVTLSGGCDDGHTHENAIGNAIEKFDLENRYGGDGPVIFSAGVDGGAAAFVSYACTDGSTPPPVDAIELRTLAEKIASDCPDQCGSFRIAGSCGIAVAIVSSAVSEDCFDRAVEAQPVGGCCSETPSLDDLRDQVEALYADYQRLDSDLQLWLQELEAQQAPQRRWWKAAPSVNRRVINLPLLFANIVSRVPPLFRRSRQVNQYIRLRSLNENPTAQSLRQPINNIVNAINPIHLRIPTVSATDIATARLIVLGGVGAGASTFVALETIRGFFALARGLFSGGGGSGNPGGSTSTTTTTSTSTTATGPPGTTSSTTTTSSTSSSTTTSSSTSSCNFCADVIQARATPNPFLIGDFDDDFDNSQDGPLAKRGGTRRRYHTGRIGQYGGSGGMIDVCVGAGNPSFAFFAGLYPSTLVGSIPVSSEEDNYDDGADATTNANPMSAPDIQSIGILHPPLVYPGDSHETRKPYIDEDFVATLLPNLGRCPVRLWTFDQPQIDTRAPIGQLNTYHTEHVFELHIMKDFFSWLVLDQGLTCGEVYDNFGPPTDSAGLWQGTGTFANEMMLQLTWFDPAAAGFMTGLTHPGEFFVLEKQLNRLKGKLMHGRPLAEAESFSRILPRPSNWLWCVDTFDRMGLVLDYLNQPEVIMAWRGPRDRVFNYLNNLEIRALQDRNFAPLWHTFITAWVTRRQQDLNDWYISQAARCIAIAAASQGLYCSALDATVSFLPGARWSPSRYTFPAAFTAP